MVDKELIENWRNMLKPSISSRLLKTNYEGRGEQDKEEFERDFDEMLDLALIGLNTSGESKPMGDLIERQAAIDAIIEDKICDDSLKIMIALGSGDKAETLNMTCDRHAKMLMSLPPAQPEERTETHAETRACDCISRSAVYDRVSRIVSVNHLDPEKVWFTPIGVKALIKEMPPAQPEEAIPVSWISAQIERLKGMDNLFADLTADIMQTTLNEWRKELEGETDGKN